MAAGDGPLVEAGTWVRAAVATPLWAGSTLASSLLAMALAPLGARRAVDGIIHRWAKLSLALYGIRLEASGLHLLPDEPAVFVFNHRSHVDVLAIHAALDRTLRFGAKIELFDVPVFGPAMRAAGVLPIARAQPSAVVSVYHQAMPRFAEGYSFALAPEGTRVEGEPGLGPFKKGPFHFALDAQVPVVPIVVEGTDEVLPKGRFRPNIGRWTRTVRLRVLAPIATRGRRPEDTERLRDEVRAAMAEALGAA